MLLRAALLALIIYGFYRWRRYRRSLGQGSSGGRRQQTSNHSQPMLPCRRCGTFVPRDDALPGPRGQSFCSSECRDQSEAE
jgi:formamidopyrimidine-DNA glycosylase